MVKTTARFCWFLRSGYSSLELAVVLAIFGLISVIAFFGLGNFNKTQLVINAQQEFLSDLRSVQNQVHNGIGGRAVKWVVITTNGYEIESWSDPSPEGVVSVMKEKIVDLTKNNITISSGSDQSICFVDKNASNLTSALKCNHCNSGAGYICSGTTLSAPQSPTVVTFTGFGISRNVVVSGLGTQITKIDTQ